MLAKKNEHPRDKRIKFEPREHKYTVDGDASFASVTTFLAKFFSKFDSLAVARAMVKKPNFWQNPKYTAYANLNVSDGELVALIVESWEKKSLLSRNTGTEMHAQIELFYNGERASVDEKFLSFHARITQRGYEAFRTEFMIFDENHKLAGCIDMLYYNVRSGKFLMADWKRTEKIEMQSFGKALEPISHMPDCNWTKYCLQLNTYKYIIDANYGITIDDMLLVCLHPQYQAELVVPNMQSEIRALLAYDRTNRK